jgi:DNA helicase-2/ATP-dependent DNA helicase PcrA
VSALDGLDERQREAASVLRGPVAVLAGAGTGKTRVITHRIAHGVETGAYTPSRVMAVTFTAKAAGELRGRLRALGVQGVAARTFHAAALSQLGFFWPQLAGSPAPAIVDNKVRLLAQAADMLRLRPDTATLRDLASAIEWRKVSMMSIEEAAARGRSIGRLDAGQVAELSGAYETLKDDRHQLDFEDVLLACAGMLEAEPRVAAAVHEQYRHFTVDEFQDVSPLQHRLLELWLGERGDLCVVGDASQTIYSFAGADQHFLLDFERRHAGATVVRLETNYRSAAGVLGVANALMKGRPGALELVPAVAPAVAEPPAVAAPDPRASPPACRPRRSRCSTAPIPSRRPCCRRSPRQGSPPPCSAASASSICPRCVRPCRLCGPPPSRRSSTRSWAPCAMCCAGSATRMIRPRPGVRCATPGRLAAPCCAWRRTRPRAPRCAPSLTTSSPGPRTSTSPCCGR